MSQQQAAPAGAFYLRPRPQGFSLYMNSCAEHLRMVRELAARTLGEAGVDAGTCENVQLVISELVGNGVRACGDRVPLVVEVDAERAGVSVKVHDPEGERMPMRTPVSLDDAESENGRGLGLVDFLAPDWQTVRTPLGKQIVCHVPYGDQASTTALDTAPRQPEHRGAAT
ncbi:ATP-binding protein [Streptomyces sp. NPDC052236]|uniref:ATP-binding protein n=1 Tax=Streptomyces sp. NPDC052236 TaxID=3365686 RepID=UPI0037D6D4AC